MSEELLKSVKKMLALGKGDAKRLREIMNTIKEGTPLPLSDYRYMENLTSQVSDTQESKEGLPGPQTKPTKRDESLEILRIRLAEGQITISEFRELKRALTEE